MYCLYIALIQGILRGHTNTISLKLVVIGYSFFWKVFKTSVKLLEDMVAT